VIVLRPPIRDRRPAPPTPRHEPVRVDVDHVGYPRMVTFNPFAVPFPIWSISTVISASDAMDASETTAGVVAVVEVLCVLSMVSLVERIDVPDSLISTVKMFPDACAVV